MRKKSILLVGLFLILFVITAAIIIFTGRTYTYTVFGEDNSPVSITSAEIEDNSIVKVSKTDSDKIEFSAVSPGETNVTVSYQHTSNMTGESIITEQSLILCVTNLNVVFCKLPYLDFNNYIFINLSVLVYIAVVLAVLIFSIKDTAKNMFFSYKNMIYVGLVIFFTFLLSLLIISLIMMGLNPYLNNFKAMLSYITNSGVVVALLLLPIIILIFSSISISNIWLLRHEGKNLTNMLGAIMGFVFVAGSLAITVVYELYKQIGDYSYNAFLIESFAESFLSYLVIYFDCMFLGAIICSIVAAKKKSAFDKDFVIILGCGIKKDGTLQPLLKGRVDRAIEFAENQFSATGKQCTFVPSGGQGSDEVISEAEAMRNYLLQQGIDEKNIIVENKSTTTLENFIFSKKLINSVKADANVVFSTTNYHLFRSGMYALSAGLKAEGIGSKTKWYFWPNAFLREFVGVIFSKIKYHIVALIVILLCSTAILLSNIFL